jgi:hypothetical protein
MTQDSWVDRICKKVFRQLCYQSNMRYYVDERASVSQPRNASVQYTLVERLAPSLWSIGNIVTQRKWYML